MFPGLHRPGGHRRTASNFLDVFDGYRSDVTTTQEMVEIMEKICGEANHVRVMDRGMVRETSLKYKRSTRAYYWSAPPNRC
jgi:hypothetical protein